MMVLYDGHSGAKAGLARIDKLDRAKPCRFNPILDAFQKLTAFKTKMMVKRMPVANATIRAACRPS
jgi:hypothetical protein